MAGQFKRILVKHDNGPLDLRPKDVRESFHNDLFRLAEANHPVTVRQMFYLVVTDLGWPKTDHGRGNTYGKVQRQLKVLRENGTIPWEWVRDFTRWVRQKPTWDNPKDFVNNVIPQYSRDLWQDKDQRVQIWLEKNALAGLFEEETRVYGVPLMVGVGYSSSTFLHEVAKDIEAEERPVYLYAFGDHDPSGSDITRDLESRLREYAPGAGEIHFKRIALNANQVTKWKLPTRPTKQSDSRAKNFDEESTELDAVRPDKLRSLIRGCIARHISPEDLERNERIEILERDELIRSLGGK